MIDTKLIRQKILDLAIRGKLVPQDPSDEPASELLKRIHAEKAALVKSGKIKKEKHESVILRDNDGRYQEKKDGKTTDISDNIPFVIPESWEWCNIGQVFYLQAGKNINSNAIRNDSAPGYYPCYGGNGLRGYVSCFNHFGDYALIGRQGALCGNINYATGSFYATEHAVVVHTFARCNAKWSGVFLQALNLNQFATATAQPGLSVQKINLAPFPLPPLAEQERIVAKVEALMNEVDMIERETENLNKTFSLTREKVLDLAIRGKLVPQDPSDEPASELLKRIQAEKIALIKSGKLKKEKPLPPISEDEIPFDIPASWSWVRLGDLGSFGGGKTPSMNHKEFWGGSVLWVTSKDMKTKYISDTGLKVTKEGAEELQLLAPGTVLMVTRSGILRHTFPVAINQKECTINQDLKSLTPFIPSMGEFVYILLKGFEGRILSDYKKSGTTVESIIWDKFKSIVLPLPPLAEQKRIIEKLKSILSTLGIKS